MICHSCEQLALPNLYKKYQTSNVYVAVQNQSLFKKNFAKSHFHNLEHCPWTGLAYNAP